jgi:iron complex outermembrane recepter protein
LLAVGRNYTKDIFTNVIYQVNDSSSLAYRTYDNLGTNKETYLRGLGAIPPGGKYFAVLGAQYNHNFYEGLYEGKPLSFKRGSWTFFTYQTLKLGAYSQLMLNGFVRLKGQLQFYELQSFGQLNMSINRQFMKRKLTATLSVNDIFLTNRTEFTINQGSVRASGMRQGDTRRVGINLRYSFGLRKKEESTNMFNLGSPENNN